MARSLFQNHENVGVQVINIEEPDPRSLEKPPDYSSVVDFPPSYEDAIKELDANKLLYNALNNNYQSPIKTVEDTVLLISEIDGGNIRADCNANTVVEKQADLNEEKEAIKVKEAVGVTIKDTTGNANVIMDKLETKNVHATTQIAHSIVEMPESTIDKPTSHSNSRSKNETTQSVEYRDGAAAISANLVSNETNKSKSIANMLRKSFRTLKNSTTLSSDAHRLEALSRSVNCDSDNISNEDR